ncbi:NC domain-containing family protein [Hibiscus syriacus]|uniref:NC domain-containing family protein n=1 Tax=Hibiscus syriacus TaxID=106335 RepID=A0A6A3AJC5_HIBSY|nr:NC domain-containing family protein [Hibiscus syriacus]
MSNNSQPTAPYRNYIPGIVMDPITCLKPRNFQHTFPISPLSPLDFSSATCNSQLYGVSLLQQLRPQQLPLGITAGATTQAVNPCLSGAPCMNPVQKRLVQQQDPEKKMRNQLRELEKQLLDDNDNEGDTPNNPIATSPTSSSSSSTTSVASRTSTCSRQTIMEVASAVSEGETDVLNQILSRLSLFAEAKGNSEHRLMEFMLLALKSRVNSVENRLPVAELFSTEHVASTQILYDLCPCFKLGFLAANLAIIDATLEKPNCKNLHIIDFDLGQGGQYVNLLHALSERGIPKPSLVKITAVADNGGDEVLKMVGDKLIQIAKQFGVCLKFNVITNLKLSDLSRDSLGCETDESLAVNFAFKLYRMPDESVSVENPRDELLRQVKALAPRVVTLVEQEMNTNTAPFASRVVEACGYYGALFDSIESTLSSEHSERVKLEEGLRRKIANSVACEGRDRVERCEVFGKWRARMSMAGFELKPMSQSVVESMRARLSSGNRVNPGFTVKLENGGVSFGVGCNTAGFVVYGTMAFAVTLPTIGGLHLMD